VTTPEIVMWAIVAVLGLGGGIRLKGVRNPTALALAVSWLVSQIYYLRTGDGLALSEYILADIAVVTVIFAKGILRARPHPWPALTGWDKCVLALFFFGAWPVYVGGLSELFTYWALYYIKAAQLLCAGMEPLATWWLARSALRAASRGDNIIEFAPAYSRRVRRYFSAPSYHRALRGEGSG